MRPYRDNWQWLGTACLVLATLFVTTGVGEATLSLHPHRVPLLTSWEFSLAYVLCALAVICFIGVFREWRFPPWVRTMFPNITIQTTRRGATLANSTGDQIGYFQVRVTNNEPHQNASLTIRYVAEVEMADFHEWYASPADEPPAPLLNDYLRMPVNVGAQRAEGGNYVYELDKLWVDCLVRPLNDWLEVEDHVSGRCVRIPTTLGTFTDKNWIALPPSPGNTSATTRPAL